MIKCQQLQEMFHIWTRQYFDKSEIITVEDLQLLTDHLAERYFGLLGVQKKIDDAKRMKASIQQAADDDIAGCDRQIEELRMECGHESRTRHGDPSGGTDSFYECNICGAELRA